MVDGRRRRSPRSLNSIWFNHDNQKQQVASIRQLRADKIGRLSAVAGTVTRTSDVRPELLVGAFKCRRCQTGHLGVEQQVGGWVGGSVDSDGGYVYVYVYV